MEAAALNGPDISIPSTPIDGGPAGSPQPALPSTTTSSCLEYQHRLCEISARATLNDPLNMLFQREKTSCHVPITAEQLYLGCAARARTKTAAGALIVEACNFAAMACWEPPHSVPPDRTEDELAEMRKERPIFAHFVSSYQAARKEVFGDDQRFWILSLMARDPGRRDKGAVRAVIAPFVRRAKEENMPLWLVAGNERARDVYSYFGFRVVKKIMSFPTEKMKREGGLSKAEEDGVPTWCMVCNWPLEKLN